MNEAGVKSAITKRFVSEGWTTFRHEDKVRGGVPDISTTGGDDRTVWIEVKTPDQPTTQQQADNLRKLGGRAFRLMVDPYHEWPGTTKMGWSAVMAVPQFLGLTAQGKGRWGWRQMYSCAGSRAEVLDRITEMTQRLMELGKAGFSYGPPKED